MISLLMSRRIASRRFSSNRRLRTVLRLANSHNKNIRQLTDIFKPAKTRPRVEKFAVAFFVAGRILRDSLFWNCQPSRSTSQLSRPPLNFNNKSKPHA
jgi:hypothetical protein